MGMRRQRPKRDEYADYFDESVREPPPRERGPRESAIHFPKHLVIMMVVGGVFLASVWLVAGQTMFEKTCQALVAPCGLVWLGLFVCVYFALIARLGKVAVVAFLSWAILTLSGNQLVTNGLTRSIESDYLEIRSADLPTLDVAMVLGGGTSVSPAGMPQASFSGDRVVTAARLFHEGKIKQLICAGTSDAHVALLIQLRVPKENITYLTFGDNTLEEIQTLDRWIAEQERRDLQVGIVTSAWHMNRALRLAKTVGLEVVPVPADFLSANFVRRPDILIPSAANIYRTTLIFKEYLAGFVGR